MSQKRERDQLIGALEVHAEEPDAKKVKPLAIVERVALSSLSLDRHVSKVCLSLITQHLDVHDKVAFAQSCHVVYGAVACPLAWKETKGRLIVSLRAVDSLPRSNRNLRRFPRSADLSARPKVYLESAPSRLRWSEDLLVIPPSPPQSSDDDDARSRFLGETLEPDAAQEGIPVFQSRQRLIQAHSISTAYAFEYDAASLLQRFAPLEVHYGAAADCVKLKSHELSTDELDFNTKMLETLAPRIQFFSYSQLDGIPQDPVDTHRGSADEEISHDPRFQTKCSVFVTRWPM